MASPTPPPTGADPNGTWSRLQSYGVWEPIFAMLEPGEHVWQSGDVVNATNADATATIVVTSERLFLMQFSSAAPRTASWWTWIRHGTAPRLEWTFDQTLGRRRLTADLDGTFYDLLATDDFAATAFDLAVTCAGRISPASSQPASDPLAELEAMIGLRTVKSHVHGLRTHLLIQQERRAAGLPNQGSMRHLVFTGNPGTGKTAVARILANIYRQLGVLPKGQLVEVDRAALVGEYVGATAIKTKAVIDSALGGVLFIDEAYTLAADSKSQSPFGQEAIDTLLKAMEDHRDEFVVIAAGYPNEMRDFLASNPGLSSRFSPPWVFDDYATSELSEILEKLAKGAGYVAEEDALTAFHKIASRARRAENFGNGRWTRNILDDAIMRHSERISLLPNRTTKDLETLTAADLGAKQNDRSRAADAIAEALAELDQLVGLGAVKDQVQRILSVHAMQQERVQLGLDPLEISNHMAFIGPPGTGKTTVARIIARVLGSLGVVDLGQLVEADRSALVSSNVGQTAEQTRRVVESALGGVLFLDEAYTLASDSNSSAPVGREAIDTLLKLMEDHRDEFVVIVAGYPTEMEHFFASNSGLRSRFDHFVEFPDFSDGDLLAALNAMMTASHLTYRGDPEALFVRIAQLRQTADFANARSVRRLLQSATAKQAQRLSGAVRTTAEALSTLETSDFQP